jgi:hypothetical protein
LCPCCHGLVGLWQLSSQQSVKWVLNIFFSLSKHYEHILAWNKWLDLPNQNSASACCVSTEPSYRPTRPHQENVPLCVDPFNVYDPSPRSYQLTGLHVSQTDKRLEWLSQYIYGLNNGQRYYSKPPLYFLNLPEFFDMTTSLSKSLNLSYADLSASEIYFLSMFSTVASSNAGNGPMSSTFSPKAPDSRHTTLVAD